MATGHRPNLTTNAMDANVDVNISGMVKSMIMFQKRKYGTVALLASPTPSSGITNLVIWEREHTSIYIIRCFT